MGILKRIYYWRRWKADSRVDSVGDVPDVIPPRHAVRVGTSNFDKWLVFDCPCRRGHRVMLNLDVEHRPRWSIGDGYLLDLGPSVDEVSRVGYCHYVVRAGRVQWIERTDHL